MYRSIIGTSSLGIVVFCNLRRILHVEKSKKFWGGYNLLCNNKVIILCFLLIVELFFFLVLETKLFLSKLSSYRSNSPQPHPQIVHRCLSLSTGGDRTKVRY